MKIAEIGGVVPRLFYGWRMIGLVSAIRVAGGGLHQYGFYRVFPPDQPDLGLSHTATSLAFSLSRAQGAIEAPLVGCLIDRFGPRAIIVAAAFLAGIGYILLSWVDTYTGFMVSAGAIYDRTQSYATVMWGLLAVLVIATLLNGLLISPWRKRMAAGQSDRLMS